MSATAWDDPPARGTFVMDERSSRPGEVMDVVSGRVYLRPPGGGTEWSALPIHLRPMDPHEDLSARVAIENARSRTGRG